MKLFRKAVVLLTTGAILASVLAAPVMAATGASGGSGASAAADDIKGTPYEGSMHRLNALGILKGYPDGRFGPQDKITRAQFATVVVRALGLDTLGAAQQGSTKFNDVTGDHWASGYINAAVGQGLVKGDPTGSFRPDAEVSYAEAAAILVRALGYEPMVKGEWPSNYLNKAGELGLTKGISFNAGEPATRGNVSLMTDAALEVDIIDATSYDGEKVTYEKTPGRNLLTEKMGLTRIIGTVTMTPRVSGGVLANNEIKVTVDDVDEARDTSIYTVGKEYTLLVADTIDPNSLLAYDVTLLVDVNKKTDQDDDVVVHAAVDNRASDQVIDRVDYLDTDATHDGNGNVVFTRAKVYLYNGKGYDFADNPVIYYNNVKMDLAELNNAYHGGGPAVKMLLDKNGDVSFFEETQMYFNSAFVSSVRDKDESILYEGLVPRGDQRKTGAIISGTLNLKDETYTILSTDGKSMQLTDIHEGDLVYLVTAPSEDRPDASPDFYHLVVAPVKKVDGTITEVYGADDIQDYKVTIGGTEYGLSRDATYSDDGNDTYQPLWLDPGLLEDLVNESVTAYLGWDGRVRHLETGAQDDHLVGVVSDAPWVVSSSTGRDVYVEITKGDGIASTYKMTDDTFIYSGDYSSVTNQNPDDILAWYNTNAALPTPLFGKGTVVNYTLKADGSLDELYEKSIDGADYGFKATVDNASAIDSDDNRIYVNGKWYLITPETAVIDATNINDISATSWKAIEDHVWTSGETWTVTLVVDKDNDPQLDGLVINTMSNSTSTLSSSVDVAMITRKSITTDGWKFTFDIEGQTFSYLLDSVSVVQAVYSDDNIGTVDTTNHDVRNLEPWDVVRFTLNSDGEIDSITEHPAYYGTVNSVKTTDNLLKIDEYTYDTNVWKFITTGKTKSFVVNADTQYYDLSNYSITRTSFDKLAKGMDVMVIDFDNDGIADAVKVFNFSDYE